VIKQQTNGFEIPVLGRNAQQAVSRLAVLQIRIAAIIEVLAERLHIPLSSGGKDRSVWFSVWHLSTARKG
jgi:hypothetical protein